MATTLRSLAFSFLLFAGFFGMGMPLLASAQTVPCGFYDNGYSNTSCGGTGTLLVYVQSLNNGSGSPFYGNNQNTFYSPSSFTVEVSGANASPASFPGSQSGTVVSVTGASSYTVSVPQTLGYTATYSTGCSGTTSNGEQATCVITMNATTATSYPPQPYPYPYTYPNLSCSPSYQTVNLGQTASFTAVGGDSVYTWSTPTQSYEGTGPVLNTSFENTGTQTVTVSDDNQIATCTVTVVPSGAPAAYIPPPSVVSYTPGLPNTGFAPVGAAGIASALIVLIGCGYFLFPYVRKAFATILS